MEGVALEAILVGILTDLGFLALLYFLLALGKLRQEKSVRELIDSYDKALKSKELTINSLVDERNYWRDTSIRLLQVGEKIAGEDG